MDARHLAAALAAAALVGAISYATTDATPTHEPEPVEIGFAPLAAGSSAGGNATNATASTGGSLGGLTTNLLYLNNTNATGLYHAKLVSYASSGVSNIVALEIGIDNGTKTPQVTGSLGALTQTAGPYVRLEPASVNRIYVTQTVSIPGSTTTAFDLEVYVADETNESAYYTMRARVSIT